MHNREGKERNDREREKERRDAPVPPWRLSRPGNRSSSVITRPRVLFSVRCQVFMKISYGHPTRACTRPGQRFLVFHESLCYFPRFLGEPAGLPSRFAPKRVAFFQPYRNIPARDSNGRSDCALLFALRESTRQANDSGSFVSRTYRVWYFRRRLRRKFENREKRWAKVFY